MIFLKILKKSKTWARISQEFDRTLFKKVSQIYQDLPKDPIKTTCQDLTQY